MWPTSTDRRPEGGYTLIEVAMVMSVFMIFMTFATPVMVSLLRSAAGTEQRVDLQQGGRAALRYLVRELRQAEVLYSSTSSARASFGVDLNGDGAISSSEQITYFVDNGILYRGRIGGSAYPLAQNASQIRFTMYGSNLALDTNGNGVVEESELNPDGTWTSAELANVTRISITLTMSKSATTQSYTADVWLRNRVVG